MVSCFRNLAHLLRLSNKLERLTMYDCIIVGAGPAGATAAYHLSKAGHQVLLLDAAQLPRYKPCGGVFLPKLPTGSILTFPRRFR
jgi:choline dehydrogenase-like flavoprotein